MRAIAKLLPRPKVVLLEIVLPNHIAFFTCRQVKEERPQAKTTPQLWLEVRDSIACSDPETVAIRNCRNHFQSVSHLMFRLADQRSFSSPQVQLHCRNADLVADCLRHETLSTSGRPDQYHAIAFHVLHVRQNGRQLILRHTRRVTFGTG